MFHGHRVTWRRYIFDELGPVWKWVDLDYRTAAAIQGYGLAEFRTIHRGKNSRCEGKQTAVLTMGRLTPEGVQARDDEHRRQAERIEDGGSYFSRRSRDKRAAEAEKASGLPVRKR